MIEPVTHVTEYVPRFSPSSLVPRIAASPVSGPPTGATPLAPMGGATFAVCPPFQIIHEADCAENHPAFARCRDDRVGIAKSDSDVRTWRKLT